MTPTQILLYEVITHGGLTLTFAILWVMERRWRRAAERRELTEFELRMDTVLAMSTGVGTLHKRIAELEKALRGDPYARTVTPAPEPRVADPTPRTWRGTTATMCVPGIEPRAKLTPMAFWDGWFSDVRFKAGKLATSKKFKVVCARCGRGESVMSIPPDRQEPSVTIQCQCGNAEALGIE